MALSTCPDCGSEHSSSALTCPKCGRPTPQFVSGDPVRRWGCLAIIAAIIFFIIAFAK